MHKELNRIANGIVEAVNTRIGALSSKQTELELRLAHQAKQIETLREQVARLSRSAS